LDELFTPLVNPGRQRRQTLGEFYGPLIKWVNFINDCYKEPLPLPGMDPRLARDTSPVMQDVREYVRDEAIEFLHGLAAVKRGDADTVEGPRSTFIVSGNRLWETRSNVHDLINALAGRDIDRVRICRVCDKLFVALNAKALTCGAVCSNRQSARNHYRKNRAAEQKRKRDAARALAKAIRRAR
jgi:hypothetical protein